MATYDVVLLAEQQLSELDARQVWSLHDSVEDQVVYHLLQPVHNAAASIESGIGALGAGEMVAAPALARADDVEDLQEQLDDACARDVDRGAQLLQSLGAHAVGEPVKAEPIHALAEKVAEVDAREAVILTRPHVVAEFFHVDWTSRARRKLGVPVLHLIEHENFDEQAESYGEEGVTGL